MTPRHRMTFETWLLFVLTEAVLSLTPGPAVLLVVSEGLRGGAARSIFSSLGILSANAVYFALSAAGLGAILLTSHEVFTVIKWAGAGYLIYVGVSTLLSRGAHALTTDGAAAPPLRPRRAVANGFALQAANPKALIFFTALLPQFVDPGAPAALQIAILGVSSVCVEFVILLGYGIVSGRVSRFARTPRFAAITNRIAGSLLIAAGLRLAATRR